MCCQLVKAKKRQRITSESADQSIMLSWSQKDWNWICFDPSLKSLIWWVTCEYSRISCHLRVCPKDNLRLVELVGTSLHAGTYLLLQLVHSPGDVFIGLLLIFLDHGLLQVLLQLLVQLFRHTHTDTDICIYNLLHSNTKISGQYDHYW